MTVPTRRVTLDVRLARGGTTSVTAAIHEPARPAAIPVLLFPGAGGSLDSEPLVALSEVVADAGHLVVRANLPHHERGGPAPRATASVPAIDAILQAAGAAAGVDAARTFVVGGRSYGGRVASMAIADGLTAAGLLCSGYPLHRPGQTEQPRVEHWPGIGVPVLFVQGDADPMADLVLLRRHRRKLPRRSTLVVVPGGDHSLRVTRARSPDGQSRTPTAAVQGVADQVAAWLGGLEHDPEEPEPNGRGPID